MTAPAHTATPWRLGRNGGVVSDSPVVSGPMGAADVGYYGGHLIAESITLDNAKFVILACNAHEALVVALRDAADALEYWHWATDASQSGVAVVAARGRGKAAELNARAALAKAKP